MKKKLSYFFIVLLFFLGLSIIIFPFYNTYIHKNQQAEIINNYNKQISEKDLDSFKEIKENASNYNLDLLNNYEATFQDSKRYNDQLNFNESAIMGYIEIKSIKAKVPIYHGTSEQVLQVGVGHLEGSSLPVGGIGTHSFIFGHRGLPTNELFSKLNKMKVGNYFTLNILDDTLYYKVIDTRVITPEELKDYIKIDDEKDLVTLVTCTPYGINTHRLLITGERTLDITEDVIEYEDKFDFVNLRLFITILYIILFAIIVFKCIRLLNYYY